MGEWSFWIKKKLHLVFNIQQIFCAFQLIIDGFTEKFTDAQSDDRSLAEDADGGDQREEGRDWREEGEISATYSTALREHQPGGVTRR